MKTLITILSCLAGASVAIGTQFAAPDLTKVHNTYELMGFAFQVLVSKDEHLSLDSVCVQQGERKIFVPLVELENIALPRLDQIKVSKELDTISVTIPYGHELPGIKGHLSKVSYEFKKDVYVGRTRIVPTKQVVSEDRIKTTFQNFRKLPGKAEELAGTEGVESPRK